MKVKLHWVLRDDPWWRWGDTISAAVLLGSAVGYAFTNRSWVLVGVSIVIGSLFAWVAEQEWRIHLGKRDDDDG